MPIIYTFPSKGTPVLADKVLISDSQDGEATKNATISSIKDTIDVVDRITAGSGISVSNATGNITIGNTGVLSLTAGTNVSLSGSTGNITVSSSPGSGTANKIPKWSNSSTLTDSIISQPVGNAITIAGNLSITSGNYIQSPKILDSAFSAGSAEQILSAGPSGSSIKWTSTFKGDLNGTINTATTGVTQANAVDNTTIATTAYVNNKIGLIPAGLEYSGTWDANTNNPTLASGVGTTGAFYIVAASGSTNLDGITDWKVGDWAIFVESGATDAWQKVDNSSVLNGSGTGQKVSLWSGSGTSVTLTDSIMTQNPSGGLFAGQYIDISGSGGISANQFNIGGKLLDGNNFQGSDGYVLSSTTVGSTRKTAWVPPLTAATTTSLGGVKTVGEFGGSYVGNPITTTSGRNYGIAITSGDNKLLVNVPWTDTDSGAVLATTSTLGGIKLGSGVTASAGIQSPVAAANRNYPLQVNSAGNGIVNVPWTGTSSTAGTGLTLTGTVFSANVDGTQSVAANTSSVTALRTYKVQVDSGDNLVVNVPWTDANTTYTAGTGLTLDGTVFNANTAGAGVVANSASSVTQRSYPVQTGGVSGLSGTDHLIVNVPWETELASTTVIGGFKLLNNVNGTAPSFTTSTANRNYAIQRDSNGRAMVNVPWTDTDTTYTAGTNVSISGTNVISATSTTSLASSTLVGGFKLFVDNAGTAPTALGNAANRNYAIQKTSSGIAMVNVPWTDTSYVLPNANVNTLGGIKSHFNYAAQQTVNSTTNTSSRSYGVVMNADNKAFVNVPWTDNGTTYTAGTGLTLDGTVFNANVGEVTQTQAANSATNTQLRTYEIQVDSSDNLVVNVPWVDTNTTYTTATSSALGLVKIGYSENGKNYPVELLNDQMFVNVPWTNTTYAKATSSTLGLVKIGFTESGKNYPVELINEQMYVNVPWTDTQAPAVTASQGLTKTSNNITLDIADTATGWAILGGGAGASTPVILGYAGANATGNKNYGITNFTQPSTVTSADNNVAIGFNSMGSSVTTASDNVVIGSTAGSSMTTATDSVLIGKDAGLTITTGGENTIIGSNAGETITTGTRNTIIGSGAIAGTGSASVFATVVGREASATSSSVAVGSGAIVAGATGVAVGDAAGTASNAPNGIALGKGAQAILQGTVGNVAIGSSANPVSLTQPEEFSASFEYLNVTINGNQYYIRLYKDGE